MRHWTDRLSEYLDGDLPSSEREALEAHLESCSECATVLEELREVVRVASEVEDRPPARDLWPEIEEEIHARGEPGVVELSSAARGRSQAAAGRDGWVRIPVSGLVAAGLALAFFSGAGAWMLRGGLEGPGPVGGEAGSFTSSVRPAGSASPELREYGAEIRELQEILDGYRERLDPATVRVLERNLAVIDRAIAESREALESDPENDYLVEHLEGNLRRKVQFLREAATTLEAAT